MMVQICYPRSDVRGLSLLLSLTTNFDEPISMQSGEQTKLLLLLLQSKKKEEERGGSQTLLLLTSNSLIPPTAEQGNAGFANFADIQIDFGSERLADYACFQCQFGNLLFKSGGVETLN